MTNIIYKEVRGGANSPWKQKAEGYAAHGTSFVVRPFNKELHWPFLDELRGRCNLLVRFDALQKAAYFDAT